MSECCEKKIIYVGKSEDSLCGRLREHFRAMGALKKNIIDRVCEQEAYEVIPYYMNPYLWHPDVEVVVIALAQKSEKAEKVLEIKEIVENIAGKIKEKLQNKEISEDALKSALVEIKEEEEKEINKLKNRLTSNKGKLDELNNKLRENPNNLNKIKENLQEILKDLKDIVENISLLQKEEKLKEELEIKKAEEIIEEIKKVIDELINKIESEIKELNKLNDALQKETDVDKISDFVSKILNFVSEFKLIATLEKILISILNPELNKKDEDILKKVRQLALRSSISKDLKSYLCNYGLKIRDIVTKVELKDELRKLKGCYVIKHKMLPEEFEDTERAKRFRECTIELFCEFCE